MKNLYICNTSSDSVSKVNLETLVEESIFIKENNFRKGPHGICKWNNSLLIANNFSNTISKIDLLNKNNLEEFYIGSRLTDVKAFNNMAYITCSENDNLIVFDLILNKIICQVSCGVYPHNIEIYETLNIALITNMISSTVSIFDLKTNEIIRSIPVGLFPTKSGITRHGELICCESHIGEEKGYLSLIDFNSGEKIKSLELGKYPVDFYYDKKNDKVFVSNFEDGSISIVDVLDFKETKKINIHGMPRGIIRYGDYLYVGDNLNNNLIIIDYYLNLKKIIPLGKEPNGMILD